MMLDEKVMKKLIHSFSYSQFFYYLCNPYVKNVEILC